MGFFGDVVDNIGTKLNLPEMGISESITGGKATSNTGNKDYYQGNTPNMITLSNGTQVPDGNQRDFLTALNAKKAASQQQTQQKQVGNSGQTVTANGTPVSGGSGGVTRDAAAERFYEAGISNIDQLIGSLGGREQSALGSLMESYLQSKNRQNVAFGDNESDYTKNIDNITRDDARKKSMIDTNVRNDMSSLRRVLGARGAGNSSAYDEVVPGAVAAKGSSDRSDAAQITAENMDTTNTNWDRYKREFEQNRLDAETDLENNQKDIKTQFAQQGIDARQKKLELETNLASARGGNVGAQGGAASVASQINELQNRINDLAARSAGRTVAAKDTTMATTENKAFGEGANTATSQFTPNGEDTSSTNVYNADDQKKSDEDLLKELLGL